MKKAIIIGATSGLGREVAARLVEKGWKVGITGRRTEALETFRNEHGADKVCIATMDVTREDSVAALDALLEQTGEPDLFFYASGVGYQNHELDLDKELRTVQTNCEGMVRMVDHFFNYVRSHNYYSPKHKAHVAVISSVAGTVVLGTAPAYSATKRMQSHYLSTLAQLSRMEHIPVCFTDIRPGFIATDILDSDKHYPMLMTKEKAADHIMKALSHKKRVYTFDWRYRVGCFFWSFIPRCIWERITWIKN
ncbi:MAG: SDR family NAD(P)-dependent oxidoreductase [Bacteroidales bacterium]|nr:SDR family NAD(P)-dependent oxidoreductase [Bacteroidales bacterium]